MMEAVAIEAHASACVSAAFAPVAADLDALSASLRAGVVRIEAQLDHVALHLRSLTGNDPVALWLALVPPAGHA